MPLARQIQRWLGRMASLRYRRTLIAAVATLLISAALLALIGVIRWRGRLALRSDTTTLLTQVGEQLVRSLQSRRGTLTFIRDTLNRRSDLRLPQLRAIAESGVQHTRQLVGMGLIRHRTPPAWWVLPSPRSKDERAQVDRAVLQRTTLRGAWRVPSTFVITPTTQRPLLIMLEPLRTPAYPQSAVIGVFDLAPLLEDFFATAPPHRSPIQLLDGSTRLYQSPGWPVEEPERRRPLLVEQPVELDAVRWVLQMQPGETHVVQTLSWMNLLVIILCVLTGLGLTAIVWVLTARAWLLQRAVARRTAALRRVLERLRQLARTDELTALFNRRYFLERWAWECRRAKRYGRPLACLLIDVNGFKQINDRLGHHVGDVILTRIAQELARSLRHADLLARFGGDEFIIALPETTADQAVQVADKLRRIRIVLPDGSRSRLPAVTLSVGLSAFEAGLEHPEAIIQAADRSLYAAKRRAASTAMRAPDEADVSASPRSSA